MGNYHDTSTDDRCSDTAPRRSASPRLGLPKLASAQANELTIAYNVNLPSWDPTTGPSAVNPTIQGIYQSVFDQFIPQKPDLSFGPGLLTEWGWNEDKNQDRDDGARGRYLA